jgi:hypothetical protein
VTDALHVDRSVIDFAITLRIFFFVPVFNRGLFKAVETLAKLRIVPERSPSRGRLHENFHLGKNGRSVKLTTFLQPVSELQT